MSLELAIERNTAAIEALIGVLKGASLEAQLLAAAPVPREEHAQEPAAPSPDAGATDASATADAATVTEEPATYEQAAAAVTALIKANGRDAAVGLLKRFGAANLKGVDPSQYGALIWHARDEAVPF